MKIKSIIIFELCKDIIGLAKYGIIEALRRDKALKKGYTFLKRVRQ